MNKSYLQQKAYELSIDLRDRVLWYLKQLLPLTYRTNYTDEDGSYHYTVWNMWFGRCFNIDDYIVNTPKS